MGKIKLWTVQKKSVVSEITKNGIYRPDINLSIKANPRINPGVHEIYEYLLNCFNEVNRTNHAGLVFAFAQLDDNGDVVTIANKDDFFGFILRNIYHLIPIWKNYEEDCVVLEIAKELDFNPIPIDYNDYNAIIPPVFTAPLSEYTQEDIDKIRYHVATGDYVRSISPSEICQIHIPYIKQDELVNIYPIDFLDKYLWTPKSYGEGRFIPHVCDSNETVGSFYTVNYRCRECGSFLLKSDLTVESKNKKAMILLDKSGKGTALNSIFACPGCRKLFTTGVSGNQLASGDCYELDLDSDSEFYWYCSAYNAWGAHPRVRIQEVNTDNAEQDMHLAADQGNADAQYSLGNLLREEGNTEEAMKYFRLAANKGHTDAQFNLGVLLNEEGNTEEAKKYYQLAIAQGDTRAQVNLGSLLENEGNIEEAKRYYRLAADQGDIYAQHNLGVLLKNEGNTKDAKEYFRAAADQGVVRAQANLGVLLYKEANEYFRLVAEQGDVNEQFNLGELLEEEGFTEEAIKYYRLAADQGDAEAQNKLDVLLTKEGHVTTTSEGYFEEVIADITDLPF